MDVNKVLFINQEISPYLPESPIANVGHNLPQGIQEKGFEVRTFMPKYGCINERRNQLHEVIRLSGMNLIIDDTDHPLIIKVATMQPARMQVYFIYNDDYFQHGGGNGLETVSSPKDNDERSMFYVRGSMETVKKLRWEPDIIHCNGWITALMPLYLKHVYKDDPAFRDAKIVYSIYDDAFEIPFDKRLADKLCMDGIGKDDVSEIKGTTVDFVQLTKLAIASSDGVIQASENINPEILKIVQESGKPFLPFQEEDKCIDTYAEFYKSL
ncbi:MAG: glycogen/starch synthase [Muribaculaceae bacterium]